MIEIVFECNCDGELPDQLLTSNLIKVEVMTPFGYIDVTEHFKTTVNSCSYKFTLE